MRWPRVLTLPPVGGATAPTFPTLSQPIHTSRRYYKSSPTVASFQWLPDTRRRPRVSSRRTAAGIRTAVGEQARLLMLRYNRLRRCQGCLEWRGRRSLSLQYDCTTDRRMVAHDGRCSRYDRDDRMSLRYRHLLSAPAWWVAVVRARYHGGMSAISCTEFCAARCHTAESATVRKEVKSHRCRCRSGSSQHLCWLAGLNTCRGWVRLICRQHG